VEAAKQLLEITAEDTGIRLNGYVSPVALTRSNRREITVFVNGRWVQDTPLTTAIVQAYHTLLMVGRYPLGALFIQIAPEDVDVNVHPAKAEVRFRDPERVFGFVQRAVRRGLLAYAPIPELTAHLWGQESRQPDPAWELAHADGPGLTNFVTPPEPVPGAAARLPLLRLVGQIGAAYVVAEARMDCVIDQRSARGSSCSRS
jgi:DNA mismatch repair protein MutL